MSVITSWTKEWAKASHHPFIFYKQTTSTNDEAKKYFNDNNKKNMLFIAESQTKGRGRRNREWINSDMMITWAYCVTKAPQPITTHLVGLALHTALKNVWKDCPFKIKEPNDIYIDGKKLAGVLVEVVSVDQSHQLIIGIGMNVFTHPSGRDFTHLNQHIKTEDINKDRWGFFLSQLHTKLFDL